jgi:hypothetical protein
VKRAAFGARGTIILAQVVLGIRDREHRDVRSYTRRHRIAQEKVATGLVVATLERLAEFYWPPSLP